MASAFSPNDLERVLRESHQPCGPYVALGSREKTEVISAELDLDRIREVSTVWQFFRDRRPGTPAR
jgi:predicted amidohydrolase